MERNQEFVYLTLWLMNIVISLHESACLSPLAFFCFELVQLVLWCPLVGDNHSG